MVMACLARRVYLIAASLASLAVFLGCSSGSVSDLARLEVDREGQNWGKVVPGSAVSTTFVIRNTGGKPLRFEKPETSCGCTKPTLPVMVLGPGEETRLAVGFQVPQEPGSVSHFVRLVSNDPDRPRFELRLYAEAWVGVRPVPQSIDLGRLEPGEEVERIVELYSPDGKPFRLGRVSTDMKEARCEVENANVALSVHKLRVHYRAGERLGFLRGQVRATTNRADAPLVDVPLAVQTIGAFTVSPRILQIDSEEIGQTVKQTALLQGGVEPCVIELVDVRVTSPWELVGYTKRSIGSRSLAVELSLRIPEKSGAPHGEVVMKVGGSRPGTYSLPLSVRGWLAPLPES